MKPDSVVKYVYLHESDISEEKYLGFLRKFYKERADYRLYKRYAWYNNYLGFHCLLAILNGEIVGQSCAFRVRMMTPSGEQEWWWGCDSFVLESARGHGVGKGMQKKLFEDHPNFSSIGYSPTNGHIKKKMGAKCITRTYPSFYPVSRWFSVWFQIAYMKMTGKREVGRINIPSLPIYSWLNTKTLKGYTVHESSFNEETIAFIQRTLKQQNDLYVIRDETYLNWKYNDNPSVQYHVLEIRKEGILMAVVIFSIAYNGQFLTCPLRLCKIYDAFIEQGISISLKDIINTVAQYYKSNGEKLDGIIGLYRTNYIATISYPKSGKELLSKYEGTFSAPYFSNSDQDLDQLLILES